VLQMIGYDRQKKKVFEVKMDNMDTGVVHNEGTFADDGKQFTLPQPGEEPPVTHVDGTVKQLNYAPRGEVDGAILDTGDFLHIGPREAAQVNLAVGQKISADGYTRPMLAGHNAIEATKVNGVTIDRPRPPRDGPPDGGPRDRAQRGPRDGRGPEGPDGDRGPRGPRPMRGPNGPPDGPGAAGDDGPAVPLQKG